MNVLEVKEVSKKIGKKQVLDKVSLHVAPGEIVGLVGKNGAGKSTLFRLITGLYSLDQGEIYLFDEKFSLSNRQIFNQVGAFIESVSLYPHMTGEEHLKWMCDLCDCSYNEWVLKLVSTLKLDGVIHDKVKTYSLGMKQRLGIIMTLVNHPRFVILDEPTNGLDPAGIIEVRNFLLQLSREEHVSILISSHILSEIEKLCDRVLLLQDGSIQRELTREMLEHGVHLEDTFLNQETIL